MKLILKKGQMLSEVFSPTARSKFFPPAAFSANGKKLNAQKFVGAIKFNDDIQKTDRENEWNQDPD
ncbi:hypothetical protein [Dyadobacter sp. BHUBP1]|uniref:hypothetical protein n=1 Tax=Dyadobacter sp. BHUBP1 TaxID=3424178 RepID=UPI003D3417F0